MTGAPERGTIRVLIADDQRVVRDGLSMLVGLIEDVEVVGTACDGAEAVRLAEAHRPDVVLMDLRMPGTDGIAATAELRQRLPSTRVLVLTTYADEDAIVPALQAGARGYLTKDASAEQIEAAIHAVHAGQTHLEPAVQERLVTAVISRAPAAGPAVPGPGQKPPGGLTPREAEVLVDAEIVWHVREQLAHPGDLVLVLADVCLHQRAGMHAPERAGGFELLRT